MNYAHLFEASMLICFGFSWPLNVIKAYRAGTAKGTSLPFIILIITGYVAGITAKIINGQFNYVLAVYFLNLAIVLVNVFVYIRNKALDKKAETKEELKITKLDINEFESKEESMTNYTNSLDEVINRRVKPVEKKNCVILLGGTKDMAIPVAELAKEFSFNFPMYNKSESSLSVASVQDYYSKKIAQLSPEGLLIHLGENDIALFTKDAASFDTYYMNFIENIKKAKKNCRIALVSIDNPSGDKLVRMMNAHIKAIAEANKVNFINLENAKLWNPQATKAACTFARDMGLNIRKPLHDVAEILYSYAYNTSIETNKEKPLVS